MSDSPVDPRLCGLTGTAYEDMRAVIVAEKPVGTDACDDVDKRSLYLVSAEDIKIARAEWVWDRRIPSGAVTLLAGREGMGKTAFVTDLAARLSRGELDGDRFGVPMDSVYVGVEDDPASVLVPRLAAARADLGRVHFLRVRDGHSPFSVSFDLQVLEELIHEHEVALIVIDPLDAHLGERVDSHRKAEVQRSLAGLARLAQDNRAAIVGIGHLNKGDGRDVLQRVIGSVGFTTSVRSVIGIGEHPDDQRDRIAVVAKSNFTSVIDVPATRFRVEGTTIPDREGGGPVETARVVWLGEELIDANVIVAGMDPQERSERDEATDFLRSVLMDGPMRYREIEKAAAEQGVSRATLHRAAKRIGITISRDMNARGRPSTWALPSDDGFGLTEVSSQVPLPTGETKPEAHSIRENQASKSITSHEVEDGMETEVALLRRECIPATIEETQR